jgi:hypothetical protein
MGMEIIISTTSFLMEPKRSSGPIEQSRSRTFCVVLKYTLITINNFMYILLFTGIGGRPINQSSRRKILFKKNDIKLREFGISQPFRAKS